MPKKASYITVYRIGHPHYIDRLDGEGAAISGGWWNEKGQRVVYTSQTSSLAILELLGHISQCIISWNTTSCLIQHILNLRLKS